ncbi:hypothetical protein OC845_003144 [Tilletia horrida]|nr:hypothetical protein OC845_003144 [Tilletia horrida]
MVTSTICIFVFLLFGALAASSNVPDGTKHSPTLAGRPIDIKEQLEDDVLAGYSGDPSANPAHDPRKCPPKCG